MKSREEIIEKAEALNDFHEDSVQTEARCILQDIAGHTDADMLSPAGVEDYMFSLERDPDMTVRAAAKRVQRFLNS